MKNRHEMISITILFNTLQYTTHLLWLIGKEKEWTWDDQHNYSPIMQNAQLTCYDCQGMMKNGYRIINMTSLQHTAMHNSHSMISRTGQRMDMINTTILQHTTMHNSLPMIARAGWRNGHGIINMTILSNILQCTTHPLWLPEEDEEWAWDNQHDLSLQYTAMHNSPTMISRAGWRMGMG